jgi:chromosome segregation ATPase
MAEKVSLEEIEKMYERLIKLNKQYMDDLKELAKTLSGSLGKGRVKPEDVKKITEAEKQLLALEKERARLQKQEIQLNAKLTAARQGETKEVIRLREELRKENAATRESIRNKKNQTGSVDKLKVELKEATKRWNALSKAERDNAKTGGILSKRIKTLKNEINDLNAKTKTSTGLFGNLKKGLAALGIIAAARATFNFAKRVAETTSQFQKLSAVLETTLGSKGAADIAFKQIQSFASTTNFSVLELTEAFVKLTNQGFRPTINQLGNLADLANSTGKSFDQLAEAIIDAQTGEFERLKEFGIRAKKEGDRVKFTS